MKTVTAAIALVAFAACAPRPGSSTATSAAIQLTEGTQGLRVIEVLGLPRDDLDTLSDATPEAWASTLRVHVDGSADARDLPGMSGSYAVVGDRVRFTPDFPLNPRVAYRVMFRPPGKAPLELMIPAAATPQTAATRVTEVYPPDTLFENHLRIYIHFSAPMSNRRAEEYIRLLDDRGAEVEGAFLPLDVNLWNADRTRYTQLFDPGRVKRGILPNTEMGRPLERGKTYTLVVDREWRDAEGRPLAESFRHDFRVVPEVLDAILPASWRLAVPRAATREPLIVTFPRPLDHALAQRMLLVTSVDGRTVEGAVAVDAATTRWTFTPNESWSAGEYRLRALSELEDPAGNRIGRAFDYDAASAGESVAGRHAEASLPFFVE